MAVNAVRRLGVQNPLAGIDGIPQPYVIAPAPSGGDDYAALQPLINTLAPLHGELILQAGAYLSSAELQIPVGGWHFRLRGTGFNYGTEGGTTIRATTPGQRSALAILNPFVQIENICLDADLKATQACYLSNAQNSAFRRCTVRNGLVDGLFMAAAGITDGVRFDDCFFLNNGTMYATVGITAANSPARRVTIAGTAAITSGNASIVITGGPDLTTFGIRTGDFVRVGATALTAYYGRILSVTSTTITVEPNAADLPISTASGLPYAFGRGDGCRESRYVDNNVNLFTNCYFRGNGGVGMLMNGIYGDTIIGGVADSNGLGNLAIGPADNAGALVAASIHGLWMENTGTSFQYFIGNATKVVIDGAPPTIGMRQAVVGGDVSGTLNGDDLLVGARNNFIVQVRNNAGTLEVRFLGDIINISGTDQAPSITGQTSAYVAIPTVDNVTPFANGAGLLSGSLFALVFDTSGFDQYVVLNGEAAVCIDNTGTGPYFANLTTLSVNVNGVTKRRTSLRLVDSSAVQVAFNTTTIPAGKTIAVRVNCLIRR